MNLNTPHAIFLDLDDTIIDDSGGVDSGWRTAIGEHARELRGLDGDAVAATLLAVRDWFWSDAARHESGRRDLRATSAWIVGEALRRLGQEAPDVAQRIAHRYRDIRDESQALMPGAVEAIETMRHRGIRLALLTNGSRVAQRAKIERFDLARHFDFICVEGEFGCGKPDERVYQAALEALRSEPESTWMVGDNLEWDVAVPMRLGLTGIWLDRHKTGLPQAAPVQPHRIVLSISEVL